MSPLGEPLEVVDGICTYTVAETEPSVGVSVMLEAYPLPEEAETSKPVGAVTVRSFVKYSPVTVNDCSVAAVPSQLLKEERDPDVLTKGLRSTIFTASL